MAGKKEKKASTTTKGPKAASKPKATRVTGKVVNEALKSKKIGSNSRRIAYKKMGLAQDHTTTGRKIGFSKPSGVTKVKSAKATPTASKSKASKVAKAPSKTDKRKASLRDKGNKALASGNARKANRIRKRYDRLK